MQKFLKHYRLIPFLLALIVTVSLSYGVVYAQGAQALSGDDVCGQWDEATKTIKNPCTINGIVDVAKNVLAVIIMLGLPLLVVFITYRFVMAWFALQQGNANAYKEALQKAGSALIGFMLIVALFGGLLFAMLQYFGVKDSILDIEVFKRISSHVVEKAYAESPSCLKPVQGSLGKECIFVSKGKTMTGTIKVTIYPYTYFCEDSTGIRSGVEDYAVDDCSIYKNNTVCKVNDYYHTFGVCSGGSVPVDGATYKCPDGTMVLPSDAKFCNKGTPSTVCSSSNIGATCTLSDNSNGKCSQVLINNVETYTCAPVLVAGTNGTTDPKYQNNPTTKTAVGQSSGSYEQLPNPINANSLYDLILDVVRLIMRFFIYPALISIWVWTGFAFVFAQGRPEALTKAKKWLMWAFATTLVIFFLQAFLTAVQGTVQKILPGTGTTQQ
jgi:hypothetical protein